MAAPATWSSTRPTGSPVKYWVNPIAAWNPSATTNTRVVRVTRRDAPAAETYTASDTANPTSSMTRSACSWLTAAGRKGRRTALALPACGPLPVTAVPTVKTTYVNAQTTVPMWRTSGMSGADLVSSCTGGCSRVRHHSTMLAAISIMDSKKCGATTHGLSFVSVTSPPITIWAGTPSRVTQAQYRILGSAGRSRNAAMNTATTAARTTPVSIRFPNSIAPCHDSAFVGTKSLLSQRGQVGHPRPEFVSLTRPPVTTMPMLAMRATSASRRTANSVGRQCASADGDFGAADWAVDAAIALRWYGRSPPVSTVPGGGCTDGQVNR